MMRRRPRRKARAKAPRWEGELLAGLTAPDAPALVRPFEGCTFDAAEAERAVEFFGFLRHSKGRWAGRPFVLQAWQARIIRAIFGWKRPDGTRLIRTLYLELSRKNGKSTFAAGIALLLLVADREPVAEIYGAAEDKEQAKIVFEEAQRMVEASPDLSELATVFSTSIFISDTGSSYKVLAKGSRDGKHGLNPHGVVLDELHALRSQRVYDALTTAQGARAQPLIVQITTAGYDRTSICWEQHDYAIKCQEGLIEDPSFLGIIFTISENDDWRQEANWYKANPNLDVSVSIDYLRDEFKKALQSQTKENAFKQLYLNIWTEQQARWLPVELWDACAGEPVTEAEFAGAECWSGLDMANTQDINAWMLVKRRMCEREVPEYDDAGERTMVVKPVSVWDILPRLWIPKEASSLQARSALRKMYYKWADEGLITLTEGNVVDHEFIREQINRDARTMQIREIAFDPAHAIQISAKLLSDGLPMVEFRQGYLSMGPAVEAMEMLILQERLRHGANTLLRWCFRNIVAKRDPTNLVKFDKSAAQEKIDPMVALAMALGRAVLVDQETPPMEIVWI